MPIAQSVYNVLLEELKSLPEDNTVEVFNFISYLKAKTVQQNGCPICAKLRDGETGNPSYNAETIKGMQEVDDMLEGKIPNTLKSFNSLEEMIADLDSDD